jgi:signal transduction histidine kinase
MEQQILPLIPPRENSLDQIVATSVIIVNEDGSVAQTLEDSLGLDEDTLRTAIQDVLEKADGTPTRGSNSTLNLYYQSKQVQSGTKIVFASSNYVDKNTTSLILTLLGAGCIALIGFYIASRFMARWAIKPVQHAWEQQQQFIGNASHELKTPLTVILANNAILQSQPTSTIESQQQWIESTEEEAHSMQELVNDMLFLAQSEGEMPSTAFQPINLTDIVERATLRFEAIAYEKGLHLDEKPIDKHVMISGDVQRIRRLVWALVDNACKYNCENGHVGISLTRTGNTCHLIVSNSGGLIDKEDLPHLFDRFYRGNHARTRDGGFGLGLSIAYSVVASHKGSIYATSTPEDGTIFTVTLPVIPDKEQREIEEK